MALTFDGSTNTISGLVINSANITDGSIVNADISASAAIASTKLSGVTSGISMCQEWRITSNFDLADSDNDTDITSNWEAVDTDGYGALGTGLTNNSGVFSFPSTGIYLISVVANVESKWPDTTATIWGIRVRINTTTDGSNYSVAARGQTNIQMNPTQLAMMNTHFIFDVTNTSTHKFKISGESYVNTTTFQGDSNETETGFSVIRLGDT